MKIGRCRTTTGATLMVAMENDGTPRRLEGSLLDGYKVTQDPVAVAQWLAPVEQPPAIYCIGLNYRRHAEETKATIPSHPVVFMKAPSAIQNPGDPIELPRHLPSDRVDYECELAIIIGKRCKNVAPENVGDVILGYCCANDVSARDWQIKWGGSQWCRAKTFDTFCPLGPWIVTPDEVGDPHALRITTHVNDELLQDWNTGDMIFRIPEIVAFLSGSTTLLPGTVILTGTPHGVGMARAPKRWLQPGETVTVEIERIGKLSNPIVNEPV
jgi:2-keto-4-pentenoate hydratase/2-oxohepta-3-ene-1,7-dioic acid hydratase in catechol pathway